MKSISKLCFKTLTSPESRDLCLANLKKVRVPVRGKIPTAKAAVLVPMCRVSKSDELCLLYTIRAAHLRIFSGQVAFPGGKTEDMESPIQTAVREAHEEIGLSPRKVDIWGHGPAVPSRGNKFSITPVIAYISDLKREDLHINHTEVSECFAIPLQTLCDPRNQCHTQFKNGYILPVFNLDMYDFKIWGITAYITHVFLSCLLSKDVYRNDWMSRKIVAVS